MLEPVPGLFGRLSNEQSAQCLHQAITLLKCLITQDDGVDDSLPLSAVNRSTFYRFRREPPPERANDKQRLLDTLQTPSSILSFCLTLLFLHSASRRPDSLGQALDGLASTSSLWLAISSVT